MTLVEREEELAALERQASSAAAGEGSFVVVEGPAGIGKTRLLTAAGAAWRRRGVQLLTARGGELEREFAFGIVRQLFEPLLFAADEDERGRLLDGAAGLAAPLLEPGSAEGGGDEQAFRMTHGLYWLAANACAGGPVAIAIDDLHWADDPSLRWLAYLAPRLAGLQLAVVAAIRTGEREPELLDLLRTQAAERLQPQPISPEGVRQLVGDRLGRPREELAGACFTTTAGNPFYLETMLQHLASAGTDYETLLAEAERDLGLVLRQRLARVGETATRVCEAVAVLGTDVPLRLAARLAELDTAAAAEAADALARAGLLQPGRPLDFAHPIVRHTIESSLAPGRRSALHARAAELLRAEGAPAGEAAAHLLAVEPHGSDEVAGALLEAGAEALRLGAPETACVLLERALAEPPSAGPARVAVLHALGSAERQLLRPAALTHLRAALDESGVPEQAAAIALEYALYAIAAGDPAAAVRALAAAVGRLGDAAPELRATLEALRIASIRFGLLPPDDAALVPARTQLRRVDPQGLPARMLSAVLGCEAFIRNRPVDEAMADINDALALDGVPLTAAVDNSLLYNATVTATLAEDFALAEDRYDRAEAFARERGSLYGVAYVACWRALAALQQGELRRAEQLTRFALDEGDLAKEPGGLLVCLMALVPSLAEQGRGEEADALLDRHGAGGELPVPTLFGIWFLLSRARLHRLQGRHVEALADVEAHVAFANPAGFGDTAGLGRRVEHARVLLALGREEDARALAAEQLALAEVLGAAGCIGVAWCAVGEASAPEERLPAFERAVAALEHSGLRLDHARALAALGAAVRREGRSIDARPLLAEAARLSEALGAAPLAEFAGAELRAAGGRRRHAEVDPAHGLTAAELRVAELAATGMSNREIAQALFLTVRTVETHLTHAYRKLDIASRAELVGALAA